MSDMGLLITAAGIAVLVVVGSAAYNAWRHPDVACRWCGGSGQRFSCSPLLNRLVGGTCWGCRGYPWRIRRIARWMGWDRNSRFSARR
jgi:hypothetical protein